MTATRSPGGWTYDEFARLPDDGNRYEVIDGELYVSPSPRPLHQYAIGELIFQLQAFTRDHDLGWIFPGPIDVLFAEGDYLVPDLVFVRRERRGIITSRGVEAAPDLVVEVLSEATKSRDRVLKRRRYAHFGVPEYWIIDPVGKAFEVHDLRSELGAPKVVRDRFLWSPVVGGPTLEIDVTGIVADF